MDPILILAAGKSSRMEGADKLALPVRGKPLLRDRAKMALATGATVCVALPSSVHPRAALLDGLDVTLIPVPDADLGLAHTLRAAVAALPACDRFLVLLADLPEITTQDLRRILAAPASHPEALIWRGATESGAPGHPVLFASTLRPLFATLTGDTGAEPIIRAHRDRTVIIPLPGQHARRDLDTPADWAAWRSETGQA
jgi:molybdenum cofactor cytidylyltransferase